MKKYILILIVALTAVTASAQTHINSLVSKLEKSPSADLTFVEKRNPSTHEITSEQYVFVVPASEIKTIINAISSDRQQSVSYSIVSSKLYRAQFKNGNVTTDVIFVSDRPSIADQAFMAGVPVMTTGENVLVVKRTYAPNSAADKK